MPTWSPLQQGLAVLPAGPGLAFALLAFGCAGAAPHLEAVCGRSVPAAIGLLTAAAWLILGLGLLAVHRVRAAGGSPPQRTRLRVWALLAVLGFGAMLGASGSWLTGSPYWFLAIPGSLAAAWLFLADPSACEPAGPGGAR